MAWASGAGGGGGVSEFFDNPIFFSVFRGGGVIFFKLTRNPNLTFLGGLGAYFSIN